MLKWYYLGVSAVILVASSGIWCSQIVFALLLPISFIKETSAGVHLSNLTERTCEIWVPNDLWTPEHCKHIKFPKFVDAQSGA